METLFRFRINIHRLDCCYLQWDTDQQLSFGGGNRRAICNAVIRTQEILHWLFICSRRRRERTVHSSTSQQHLYTYALK